MNRSFRNKFDCKAENPLKKPLRNSSQHSEIDPTALLLRRSFFWIRAPKRLVRVCCWWCCDTPTRLHSNDWRNWQHKLSSKSASIGNRRILRIKKRKSVKLTKCGSKKPYEWHPMNSLLCLNFCNCSRWKTFLLLSTSRYMQGKTLQPRAHISQLPYTSIVSLYRQSLPTDYRKGSKIYMTLGDERGPEMNLNKNFSCDFEQMFKLWISRRLQ